MTRLCHAGERPQHTSSPPARRLRGDDTNESKEQRAARICFSGHKGHVIPANAGIHDVNEQTAWTPPSPG
jgi:hypothetical protein